MTERNEHHTFKTDEIPYKEISDPAALLMNPLVSVKMITYNHEPYIAQAIESVVNQETEYPFELIIGEDCSTDRTREIVFECQKKYPDIIRVITSDKNVGMRKNGYRTIKACRGKYIAFCEGDDYWHHPHKLQKQVDYMKSHPECGMVFGDCNIFRPASNQVKERVNYYNGYQSQMNLTIYQVIDDERMMKWTCTAMVRQKLYEQVIEGDPYLHQSKKFLMGDLQLWAELAAISEVTYIPECVATYRILEESASNSKDKRKKLLFWISASDVRLYLCNKYGLSGNVREKAELVWCDKSLQLAFLDRNPELALKVKVNKQAFTWKEWLRYWGAKNLVFYYVYSVAAFIRNLFRKEHNPWL